MVKGVFLALAVAWLAVANPTANVALPGATSPATINSAHGSKPISAAPATPVPEPSTLISLVFGVGLLGGVLLRLRSSR